jgi:hypothetical protein
VVFTNVVFADDSKKELTNMADKTVCIKEAAGMTLAEMQLAALAIGLLFDPEKFDA